MVRKALALLGVAAVGCYAIHAAYHVVHGRPHDVLWACHIGAAVVGVGLLLASARLNAIGVLLLCLGTPLWLLDLAGGGEFLPTSCCTHLGGLAIGLLGVRILGLPRGVWWQTTAALLGLVLLCRLVTPAEANVNVAFTIQHGWEAYFPSHPVYLGTMLCLAAGYWFLAEAALRRVLVPEQTLTKKQRFERSQDKSEGGA